jgi:hypothetical protein
MRWLVGFSRCRLTQEVLEAGGHEVWTCDLLPAEHERHLQCDVWDVVGDRWDAAIFHPMCSFLTVSAAWAFSDPDFDRYPGVGYHQRPKPETLLGEARRQARAQALEEFRQLLALPYPKVIENPGRSFVSTAIRKADQFIHPYQFGDDASKLTGLWLDRLPPLRIDPRDRVPGRMVATASGMVERWANQTDAGQNRMTPSEDRWLQRSATYPGIARAFGQWGAA